MKNTLHQISLPPQNEIIAQVNNGDLEMAVFFNGAHYESVAFYEGDELWRQPHHDAQSAIFAISQALIAEYAGQECDKLTRERIVNHFSPEYFLARQ